MTEMDEQESTFKLTPEQLAAIEEAKASLEAGLGIPHEEVKERLKKKYPGLINWE